MRKIITTFLLFSIFIIGAQAQTSRGTIRGTVLDPAGAVIPGATITITNEATNEKRNVTSGQEGEFTIASLPAGRYSLEITYTGFKKHVFTNIDLSVNQERRFDVTLEVRGKEIVIDDDFGWTPPLINLDSATLKNTIQNKQISSLPLDGRNFYELNLLVPGAVPNAPGSAGSVRGDFAFSVNGAREDSNNFLLDGVYNVDPKLNTFGVRPPVDAIQEFEIATSSYDAAFGRNAGAQVNVVLKSGTNAFHGSAYEFFRNAALDARNVFAPANEAKPKYLRNQFGFTFGGPIVKDKTFFFADYEGTRSREGITRITNVPTLQERNGNFSAYLPPTTVVAANNTSCNPIRLDNGQPFINTPTQFILCNQFTPTPTAFAGNVIPSFFLNPISQRIANLYPLPNRNVPFSNFVSSPTQRDDNNHFDVRLDHILNEKASLVFRYSLGDRKLFEPFTGPTFSLVPGFGDNVNRRSQNLMIGETHILSPVFVNEVRFAFNRVASSVTQENAGTSINRQVGLPDISTNPRDFGLSFISVTGFSPLGHEGNNPQNSVTNTFQILDTASYVRNTHLFKFGLDLRHTQQNAFRDIQSRGFLNFSPFLQLTGNALGDLLLGFPIATGVARVDNAQHIRTNSYNFFISDSWRIKPRFTLSYGVRYELNTPAVDAFDRARLYDPTTRTLVAVGTNGVPRGGYETDKNNFAPRIGFAWTLDKSEKTVLRAGYGVYYDQSPLAPGEALYFNAPFFDINIYFPIPGLPLTVNNPFPAFFPVPLADSALAIQRDLRTPYMQHWNVNLQREFGRNRVLEVAYVGSKGTKLLTSRDINQPQPGIYPNPLFLPRPNPAFADITQIEARANSNYHSLQARFQQRLDFGLAMLASYTWSKSIDDASGFFTSAGDPNFPQDSYNVRAERGLSNFDVRHRLSVSYSYALPFGKGKKFLSDGGFWSNVFGNWETFGIVTAQSGRPFTVALLPDIDISGTGRSSLGFGNNDRPNIVGNPTLSNATTDRWFNTSAFAFPTPGTFGSAGRNILKGPDYFNVNASLVKNINFTEQVSLQFRFETFNLFNRPNYDLPDNFLGSPTFGRITSARDPRHLQFGLKLLF